MYVPHDPRSGFVGGLRPPSGDRERQEKQEPAEMPAGRKKGRKTTGRNESAIVQTDRQEEEEGGGAASDARNPTDRGGGIGGAGGARTSTR